MTDCLFCKIVNRKLPSEIVYEDEDIIGIKSIKPEAPIHLLFIVKKHLEWKDRFSEKEVTLLGRLVSLAKKIAKDQKTDRAYKLIFNVGETAHFPHIHLHLLGGWQKDIPLHNI